MSGRVGQMLQQKHLWALLLSFSCAYLLFPLYFELPVYATAAEEVNASLDASWMVALNFANVENLVWGRDFIFTCGPLSFLFTRIGWGESRMALLCFDLFVSLNFFFLVYSAFGNSKNKILSGVLILVLALMLPHYLGAGIPIVLMCFLIFWIRKSTEAPRAWHYLFQSVLLVLLFYIKFNTGLISFLFFYIGLVYQAIYRKYHVIWLILWALVPLAGIYLLSDVLNVALQRYIALGFDLVSGYNEIMYIDDRYLPFFGVAVIAVAVCIHALVKNLGSGRERAQKIVLLSLFLLSAFVIFKQAFVRGDSGHFPDFYKYFPLLLLAFRDFNYPMGERFADGFKMVLYALSVTVILIYDPIPIKLLGKLDKSEYVAGFTVFTPTSGLHMRPPVFPLPETVIRKIGDATADVFPWNIKMTFENGLRYHPRPVIQTYTAYTYDLEQANFDHYNSARAPQFVLFDLASVDRRYAFFDEPKVHLALLENYKVAERFTYCGRIMLLLERKPEATPLKLQPLKTFVMPIGDSLVPKETRYYEVKPAYTWLGKCISIIWHAPTVRTRIFRNDGQDDRFRTSNPLLSAGIFSTRFIENAEDFGDYLEQKTVGNHKQVKYYRINPVNSFLFKDDMEVLEYEIVRGQTK